MSITATLLRAMVEDKFFGVEFIKKDGTLRVMNARLGVKKGTNGKGLAYNPIERGYLPVYDRNCGGFRMINLKTIKKLTVKGRVYEF